MNRERAVITCASSEWRFPERSRKARRRSKCVVACRDKGQQFMACPAPNVSLFSFSQ